MDMSPLLSILCCEDSSFTSCCMKCQDGWWGILRIHGMVLLLETGAGKANPYPECVSIPLRTDLCLHNRGYNQPAPGSWLMPTRNSAILTVNSCCWQIRYSEMLHRSVRGKSVLLSPCISLCWHTNVVYVVSRSKKNPKNQKTLPNIGPFSLDLPGQVVGLWWQVLWSTATCLSQRRGYFVIL